MKPSLPTVILLIHILSLAASPLQAQQISDEDIEAMLRTRQFEIGGTRTTEPQIPEEGRPTEDGSDEADDSARASRDAGSDPSGSASELPDLGGITGLARSLMDAAAAGAGGLPSSPLGTLGQGLTGSIFDSASAIAASGGDAAQLSGADAGGILQQMGSMLEAASGTTATPGPVPLAGSLDNARAIPDAYNTARPASTEAAAGNEALAPAQSDTRVNVRVQPSARRTPERRDEEEREPLPWETNSRRVAEDDAAGRAPSSPVRSSATRSVPAGGARTEATTGSERPATAVSAATGRGDRRADSRDAESIAARVGDGEATALAPERFRELFNGVPSYEDAVAERDGDWFVVLGSYNVRAGATPIPSAFDGSVERSASAAIAGAQQRLWQAGYVPYVVRSDALPRFQKGLAVIVLGPLARSAAATELPALRRIISDAYIKAGW